MKLAIIGSRTFTDYELLKEHVSKIDNITEIISGGASGADKLGARYAQENNIVLTEFFPNWKVFGKQAGFIRNRDIIANCDSAIAFWDGKSKGTKNSIELAYKMKKSIKIIGF